MDILYKKTEDIVPYFQNPRVISESAIEEVAKSLHKHGFQQAIVIDENNVIVAGHTRLLAAKKLGIDEVPCKIYTDNEININAYRLADNKVGELTVWEDKILELELEKLQGIDVAGFKTQEVQFTPFDTSFADVKIEEAQVGYSATDLTNQVPLTFYLEKQDREEVTKILETVRDEKDLQTKNNTLLYLLRKNK
jgi:site-specific DNA-methyltransferase (adenine-specific)|tara:strand:+ start:6689 stop:7270 length:582 start_codon:yes stop_codon:yes gene_type:complete